MRALRLQIVLANALTYVDPENFSSTLVIRHDNKAKLSSNKTSLVNSRSEIITNRNVAVVKSGCTDNCVIDEEVVSVRTSISGSVLNAVAVEQALRDHLYNLQLAFPDLIRGLLPALDTAFKTETTEGA